MRRLKLLVFLPLAAGAAAAGGSDGDRFRRFERQVAALREEVRAPGLAAAVVRDGRLAWSRGFGWCEADRRRPVTDRTPFRLASVTKPVMSYVALQLAAEGKLRLDGPAPGAEPATLRQVLSHTAGGPFRYSNENYRALGPAIEAAAGRPLRRVLEERVIIPLGLADTAPGEDDGACAGAPDALDDDMAARDARVLRAAASPHASRRGRPAPSASEPSVLSAAAGMISSARDLAAFAAALPPAYQAQAFSPARDGEGRPVPYGLGWFTGEERGVRLAWHHGYVPGVSSAFLLVVPERGLALVLLANADGLSAPFADALDAADPAGSAFAADFLRIFVFDDALPDPDWTSRPGAFARRLARAARPDYDYAAERRAGAALRAWRRRLK